MRPDSPVQSLLEPIYIQLDAGPVGPGDSVPLQDQAVRTVG